jgi:hypothetical protein
MCLWCSWKDLDEHDLMEFNGKIWIQNVGDIYFYMTSTVENSNKFLKTRFWKEKSVENMVTLGPMAQATLAILMIQRDNIMSYYYVKVYIF